jgi:hypothetical protein
MGRSLIQRQARYLSHALFCYAVAHLLAGYSSVRYTLNGEFNSVIIILFYLLFRNNVGERVSSDKTRGMCLC